MALPKLFNRIIFHNNTTPSLNEDNENAMSKAIDDIDDRVIALAGTIMEDVPQIQEALEILEPAIENIDSNVERAETAADDAEDSAETAEHWANVSNPPIPVVKDFANVITVDDAIPKAATDVKVKVEAVQDLHGYTKPWVGGAGKNLIALTEDNLKANSGGASTWNNNTKQWDGITFTILTDNGGNCVGIKANGTATANITFVLTSTTQTEYAEKLAGKNCFLSGCPSGGGDNKYKLQFWSPAMTKVDAGNGVAISFPSTVPTSCNFAILINSGITLNNVIFYPQCEIGSSKTAFEPYSNICPISGFTEVDLPRTGKNLWNEDYTNIEGGLPVYKSLWVGKGTFTMSTDTPTTSTTAANLFFLAGKQTSNASTPVNGVWSGHPITVQSTDGYVTICYRDFQDVDPRNYHTQIEFGDTATPYEPYNGTDYIIDLDGTRYGATLDVTSGVMTVTRGYNKFSDRNDWGYTATNNIFYVSHFTEKKYGRTNIISDAYATTNKTYQNLLDGEMCGTDTDGLNIKDDRFTTVQAFLEAMGNAQLCYELATPITVQLTPTEVQMLQGYNVLSANSGDVYLKYDASMIQRIANEKLDISTFKSVVASSSDFADFKTKVAAL